jgi:L-lactate dehydrogenase complex protein LldG
VTRELFLQRVREAVTQGAPYRVQTRPILPGAGYAGVQGDWCERWAAEATAVGGMVERCANEDAARERLIAILEEHKPRSALIWNHPLLERFGLRDVLGQKSVAVVDPETQRSQDLPARKRARIAAEIGITSCDRAVAETGSLMMCAGFGHERVASLLPPIHVAIVWREQLVADLMDALAWVREQFGDAIPSNVVFITGPSKSGDIEQQLTIGVHGPRQWRTLLIEG